LPQLRSLSHFLRCRLNTQDLKLSNICALYSRMKTR
jgi:hypothetical protein